MKKSVFIVGIGMDGGKTLTAEGMACIEKGQLLIGAKRMLEPFSYSGKECFVSYNCDDIHRKIAECEQEIIVVLVSGDCGFYSMAQKLCEELDEFEIELVCGISSPVYFSSRIGVSWQDMKFVSLHGVDSSIARHAASNEKCFFLLGGKITAADLCKRLVEYGMGDIKVSIGERLAMEDEVITTGRAEELVDIQTDRLCVLVTQNPAYERYLRTGIADNEFIRGSVPMTKAELRAVAVARLNVPKDGICWDIGCGTGSVSIEMAMRCPDGYLYALDRNEEAIALTNENAHKFRCDNIHVMCGNAPDALKQLPVPDCIFIGGSSGHIDDILELAFDKNAKAAVVITAVSLETINQAVTAFDKFNRQPCITQLAVTNTRKIGSHTMLAAQNPVFVISWSEE